MIIFKNANKSWGLNCGQIARRAGVEFIFVRSKYITLFNNKRWR